MLLSSDVEQRQFAENIVAPDRNVIRQLDSRYACDAPSKAAYAKMPRKATWYETRLHYSCASPTHALDKQVF
jgi:hypothetical protein